MDLASLLEFHGHFAPHHFLSGVPGLNNLRDALLVLAAVPFSLVGGVLALLVTGTHFSISAAMGFLSLFGVAVQGALILISRMQDMLREGYEIKEAILKSAEVRMRPVLMTSLAAAIASGIGAQSQQPLARVVVGGMLTSAALILLVLPVLYQLLHRFGGPATPPNRQDSR